MRFLLVLFLALGFVLNYQTSNASAKESLSGTLFIPVVRSDSEKFSIPGKENNSDFEKPISENLRQTENLIYNGYKIRNTKKGLSIYKNGKRRIFAANVNETEIGRIGLENLVKNNGKQLIYETWSGGNHCCSYFEIIDLSRNKPRILYRSKDYDIGGSLYSLDINKDGRAEIQQSFRMYLPSPFFESCALVSNPVIYVNFEYNRKERKFLPANKLSISQKQWIEESESEVLKANSVIKTSVMPEIDPCKYTTEALIVTMNYVFSGKEKEGLNFFEKKYFTFKLGEISNEKRSKSENRKMIVQIKQQLAESKMYRKIYRK